MYLFSSGVSRPRGVSVSVIFYLFHYSAISLTLSVLIISAGASNGLLGEPEPTHLVVSICVQIEARLLMTNSTQQRLLHDFKILWLFSVTGTCVPQALRSRPESQSYLD